MTITKKGKFMMAFDLLLTLVIGGSVAYKYMNGQDITSDYIMSIMSVVLLFIIYKSKIVIYVKQVNTSCIICYGEGILYVMNVTLAITALFIIIIISLLWMVARVLYKDHLSESPLFIITDKRSMIIDETDDYLKLIHNERSVFLVELNGEFFVNVTGSSYNQAKIGDQVMLASGPTDRDFIIKKI